MDRESITVVYKGVSIKGAVQCPCAVLRPCSKRASTESTVDGKEKKETTWRYRLRALAWWRSVSQQHAACAARPPRSLCDATCWALKELAAIANAVAATAAHAAADMTQAEAGTCTDARSELRAWAWGHGANRLRALAAANHIRVAAGKKKAKGAAKLAKGARH
eukprot:gene8643-5408_t